MEQKPTATGSIRLIAAFVIVYGFLISTFFVRFIWGAEILFYYVCAWIIGLTPAVAFKAIRFLRMPPEAKLVFKKTSAQLMLSRSFFFEWMIQVPGMFLTAVIPVLLNEVLRPQMLAIAATIGAVSAAVLAWWLRHDARRLLAHHAEAGERVSSG